MLSLCCPSQHGPPSLCDTVACQSQIPRLAEWLLLRRSSERPRASSNRRVPVPPHCNTTVKKYVPLPVLHWENNELNGFTSVSILMISASSEVLVSGSKSHQQFHPATNVHVSMCQIGLKTAAVCEITSYISYCLLKQWLKAWPRGDVFLRTVFSSSEWTCDSDAVIEPKSLLLCKFLPINMFVLMVVGVV